MLELTLKIKTKSGKEIIKKIPHDSSIYHLSLIVSHIFMLPPHKLYFFLDGGLVNTSPLTKNKWIDFYTNEDYKKVKVMEIKYLYEYKATLTVFSNRNELYSEAAKNAKILALCAWENPNFAKLPLELLKQIFTLLSIGVDRVNSNSLFSNCLTLKIRNQEKKFKKERESIPTTASGFFKSTPIANSSDEAQELDNRDLTTALT